MSSTLPKSVLASQAAGGDRNGSISSQDRAKELKDFVEKIKQMPDEFLRIPASYYPPQEQQLTGHSQRTNATRESPLIDMIDISVVEAQLVKNYGLLRMDLYCKIRVGHMVCETQTCVNGAKNPKWDGVYQFSLKPGIDSFHLEIYDEKQFSLDEKIAWLHETIPQEIFQGITVERWFPLTGRLGSNKEGSILLVLSHKRVPMRASNFGRASAHHQVHHGSAPITVFVPASNQGPILQNNGPAMIHPAYVQPPPDLPQLAGAAAATANAAISQTAGGNQIIVGQHQQQQQQQPATRPVASEEDINQLSEMFPAIDKAIIKAILENNHNDKEASIGALLALA